ncbi:hypothetical protein [Exiguobacterium sp. 22311]|uniref:hypothetical protein n=1 Tax=Exiguobacterium sp. 22311 TaxID=3453907 RepID=UPI003F84B3C7
MAKILFITGDYYPNFSPNGSVIKNIIEELRNEHTVEVLATKNNFNLENEALYNNYKIHRVNNYFNMVHNYFVNKQKESSNTFKKNLYNVLLQIKRVTFFLFKLLNKNSINNGLINTQIKEIKKIKKNFDFEFIIPIAMPYENIISAVKYKKLNDNSVKILPYQIDHFADSPTLHGNELSKKIKFRYNLNLETYNMNQSDHYYIFPQIEKHIKKHHLDTLKKHKVTITEHPLLTEKINTNSSERSIFMENRINLLFSGMLNTKIRNPKYLLDMTLLISNNNSINLNFFHVGNCESIINEYRKKLDDHLFNFGSVPLKQSFEGMVQADILISLGVSKGNQVSGKIFDYFSTGKPIIHLYYFDEDPNLKYLNKYPLALCLKIDYTIINEQSNKFYEFCINNVGKQLKFEEVEKIFNDATPKFVSKQFNSKIKELTFSNTKSD